MQWAAVIPLVAEINVAPHMCADFACNESMCGSEFGIAISPPIMKVLAETSPKTVARSYIKLVSVYKTAR